MPRIGDPKMLGRNYLTIVSDVTFKAVLILLGILTAIGIAAFGYLRPAQDDGSLASGAAQTVSGDEQAMYRVTKTVFRMSPSVANLCRFDPTGNPPHAGYYCHVFANSTAVETIKSGHGEYPVGSIIVKQKYSSRSAQNTELFTIMRKMEGGYDDENGDWEYSMVDSSGNELLSRGRDASCISCHTHYKETDYVSRVYLQH